MGWVLDEEVTTPATPSGRWTLDPEPVNLAPGPHTEDIGPAVEDMQAAAIEKLMAPYRQFQQIQDFNDLFQSAPVGRSEMTRGPQGWTELVPDPTLWDRLKAAFVQEALSKAQVLGGLAHGAVSFPFSTILKGSQLLTGAIKGEGPEQLAERTRRVNEAFAPPVGTLTPQAEKVLGLAGLPSQKVAEWAGSGAAAIGGEGARPYGEFLGEMLGVVLPVGLHRTAHRFADKGLVTNLTRLVKTNNKVGLSAEESAAWANSMIERLKVEKAERSALIREGYTPEEISRMNEGGRDAALGGETPSPQRLSFFEKIRAAKHAKEAGERLKFEAWDRNTAPRSAFNEDLAQELRTRRLPAPEGEYTSGPNVGRVQPTGPYETFSPELALELRGPRRLPPPEGPAGIPPTGPGAPDIPPAPPNFELVGKPYQGTKDPNVSNLRIGQGVSAQNPAGTALFEIYGRTFEAPLPNGTSPIGRGRYGDMWARAQIKNGNAVEVKPRDQGGELPPAAQAPTPAPPQGPRPGDLPPGGAPAAAAAVPEMVPISDDKVLKFPDMKAADEFITSRRMQRDDTIFEKAQDPQTGEVVVRNNNFLRREPRKPADPEVRAKALLHREDIIRRGFPQEAFFGGEPVTVLGVIGKEGRKGEALATSLEDLNRKGGQLLIKRADGSTAIVIESSIKTIPATKTAAPKVDTLSAEIKAAPPVETDPARVQEIKNSIAEGEMLLKGGKKNSGQKFSAGELEAIRRSVNNSRAKIGMEPLETPKEKFLGRIKRAKKEKAGEERTFLGVLRKAGGLKLDDRLYAGEVRAFSKKESGLVGVVSKTKGQTPDLLTDIMISENFLPEGASMGDFFGLMNDLAAGKPPQRLSVKNLDDTDAINQYYEERAPEPGVRRAPWTEETSKAVTHTSLKKMEAHPDYPAAKSGDPDAAIRLTASIIDRAKIKELADRLAGKEVELIPVMAEEMQGRNAIPLAMAKVISRLTGWEINYDVVQVNRPGRTQKSQNERLFAQAEFAGQIKPDVVYILIDDAVSLGGTLANLAGHVQGNGGTVGGIHVGGAGIYKNILKNSIDTIQKLKDTWGDELGPLLESMFGKEIELGTLTEAEARAVIAHKKFDPFPDEETAGPPEPRRDSRLEGRHEGEVRKDGQIPSRKPVEEEQPEPRTTTAPAPAAPAPTPKEKFFDKIKEAQEAKAKPKWVMGGRIPFGAVEVVLPGDVKRTRAQKTQGNLFEEPKAEKPAKKGPEVKQVGMFDEAPAATKGVKEGEQGNYSLEKKDQEDKIASIPASVAGVSIPFMLTAKMKAGLRSKGLTDEFISELTPEQAHEILLRGPGAKAGDFTREEAARKAEPPPPPKREPGEPEPQWPRSEQTSQTPPGQKDKGPTREEMKALLEKEGPSDLSQLTDSLSQVVSPKDPLMTRIKKALSLTESTGVSKDSVTSALASMKAFTAAQYSKWRDLPSWTDFKDLLGDLHFSHTKSALDSLQFTKSVLKQVPSKLRREAITNWTEAEGNDVLLAKRAEKSGFEYKKGYEVARTLNPSEKILAENVNQYFLSKLEEAKKWGMLRQGVESYVSHLFGKDDPKAKAIIAEMDAGILKEDPFFIKKRIFNDLFSAEQAGLKPKKDIGFILGTYDQAFNEAIAARGFIRGLHDGKASDGNPLGVLAGVGKTIPVEGATSEKAGLIIRPKVLNKKYSQVGYRNYDHPSLKGHKFVAADAQGNPVIMESDMMLHPEIYNHVKKILAKSAIRENAFGRGVLAVVREAKATILSASPFHQTTIGLHAAEHKINPFTAPDIDLTEKDQRGLVRHGLTIADHGGMQQLSEGVYASGLLNRAPVLGPWVERYGKYLFSDLIPRIKMQMGLHALERNRERYGKTKTEDQIFELTAKQSNAAFGGENLTFIGRSKTAQDILTMLCFAPDFLLSRAKFVGQAFKPYGKEQSAALIRGALWGVLGIGVINAALNDGDPHLEDPLVIHAGGRKIGFRLIQSDILHLLKRPVNFAYFRLNPTIVRPALEAITERNAMGQKRTPGEQVQDFFTSHIPIPIQGLVKDTGMNTILQSVMQSIGASNWKDRTKAEQMISDLAFRNDNMTSDQKKRSALRRKAMREYSESKTVSEDLKAAVREKKVGQKEAEEWLKDATIPELVRGFKHLSQAQAAEVWKAATHEEKKKLFPLYVKKTKNQARKFNEGRTTVAPVIVE